MADSLNDLGVRDEFEEDEGRRLVREERREEEGAPYRDSRRPCPSIYHSRIIGPCADIPGLSREEGSSSSFLRPVGSPASPPRFVSFGCEGSGPRGWREARLPLAATLFSHDARNSIQSSRRDLCRTLRSFVYRPFKAAFRGRPTASSPPRRNSNSSPAREPFGEPDALGTRRRGSVRIIRARVRDGRGLRSGGVDCQEISRYYVPASGSDRLSIRESGHGGLSAR